MNDINDTRNKIITDVKERLKRKYPHIEEQDFEDMFESATQLYISYRYRYYRNIFEVQDEDIRDYCIIGNIVNDYIERNGVSSVVSYSENGLSWHFESAGVSPHVLSQITIKPKVV